MRVAGLIAVATLVAGCSQSVGGQAESSSPAPVPPEATTSTAAAPSSPPSAAAPGSDASIDDVIRFIEGGAAADPGTFHVAFRDGVTTRLGEDIAFTAPSGAPLGTTQCLTVAGGLTCLLDLTSPPPRPTDAEGVWKAGWVEFPGTELRVGALRGDPGPFVNGSGTELPAGQSLSFGDDRCRSDDAGLYCVNYAHRAAVLISADGVVPFGCLQPSQPPAGVGAAFRC
ncbi:hypothetical protein BST22_09690 [Mycolicibacterium chubuense]|uniref:LppI n=1 Tax=Mycolicibacterium chubuense TaxID=1800 RepID=A0A0J6WQM7_MYCCU|nr:hypothetical protein [Mycolicibacterium chubuense]KMO84864.1 hypothetical protein MCHUDSM44219_00226 [Mycolicibacterium chubuense]ORA53409.1 hypothetical protein BST22_09690 [Mycolicibacterium chubuense]SPX96398.1 LppI [Mycolicibacterium chubuense]